ncbi:trigger factor [Candidatus Cardinium hertigii]|uniref:trigger factor n=1 Tax=Candidatus Cardinium hertigii TaxID=247481 RepID=UPI00160E2A18|nr:trigger factor [Candidatus Cardinium hertigii]
MDIQFNKINPNHGVVCITLYEPDYKPVFEKQLKHYARNVRVKGFRVGAVPVEVISKMYGRSILTEELLKVAASALKNYIEQEQIPIFIEPLLVTPKQDQDIDIDLPNQQGITFSYEIGLMEYPTIELGPHISVTEFKISQVEGKLVDEFVEALQLIHGQRVNLNESTADAILSGSLEMGAGTVTLPLRISVAYVPEGLRETLVGLSVGAKVMITQEMLKNHFAAILGISFGVFATLKKKYIAGPMMFTIDAISQVVPAPIEPTLFNLIFGKGVVDSVSSFREAITKIILLDKCTEASYTFFEDLRDELFKYNSIHLPDVFLKKWLSFHNPVATPEEVEDYYNAFEQDVRWELLLGNIVRKNNLTVTESEVIDEAKRIYADDIKNKLVDSQSEFNDSTIYPAVITMLAHDKGKLYIKLHQELSKNRAINFIKQHISVVPQTVTAEQFDARI